MTKISLFPSQLFIKRSLIFILYIAISSLSILSAQRFAQKDPSDTINRKRLTSIVAVESVTYLAGVSYLSFNWYKDHERVPFHFYNDLKGYCQIDKAGHTYGAYWESYAAYSALRWSGVDKKKALIYGGPIGLIFQTPIEVLDGLFEGWGFSWTDMGANTLGSALFISQEILFDEQIVHLKFSYSPSGYPKYHYLLGENELESFFYDYNGHTYWLSGNLNRITGIKKIPSWLNIAFGYSANGMIKEFENPEYYNGKPFPELERYRQYIFSFDIDLSKIHTRKRWLNTLLKTVNVIKIPCPAIEYNRVDKLKIHSIYY